MIWYDLEYYSNRWILRLEYTALYKYVPDRGVNQQVHDEVNNKHKGDKQVRYNAKLTWLC